VIWLAWRRQRMSVLTALGLGVIAVAGMLALRFVALSYMDEHGIGGCRTAGTGCDFTTMNAFAEAFSNFELPLTLFMFALPPLVGAFTGGPLFAGEIENGTHTFVLTQGVSRARWWAAKIVVGVLPVLTITLLVGLIAFWTMEPLSYVTSSPIRTPGFETQGIVLAAYTVLAFAIGSTAGLLLRNTLGAMVVAIAVYIVLLVAVGSMARPEYAEPVYTVEALAEGENGPQTRADWQLDYGYLDAAGNEIDAEFGPECGAPEQCLRDQGVVAQFRLVQPRDRYWSFQAIESALIAGIAALFIGVGAWAVRRVRN